MTDSDQISAVFAVSAPGTRMDGSYTVEGSTAANGGTIWTNGTVYAVSASASDQTASLGFWTTLEEAQADEGNSLPTEGTGASGQVFDGSFTQVGTYA